MEPFFIKGYNLDLDASFTSFTKRTKSDVITYYARCKDSYINEEDVKSIKDLISYAKKGETKKVILLLHTLGGDINAAISLIEDLRKLYLDSIETIVFKVAKSSGAFLGISSDILWMVKGSVLSDFTLAPDRSDVAYNNAQKMAITWAFWGMAGRMDFDYWMESFVYTNKLHGTPIPKEELVHRAGVRRLTDFPNRTKPLAHIHNAIIDEFIKNPELKKVIGYNELVYSVS